MQWRGVDGDIMRQDNEKFLWQETGESNEVILPGEPRKKPYSCSFQAWLVRVGPIIHSVFKKLVLEKPHDPFGVGKRSSIIQQMGTLI